MEHDRVLLTLTPDPAWLPLIEDVVRRFAARLRFPERLTEMLAAATLEACDNLAVAAREHGIRDACHIGFASGDEAVSVDIDYPASIPLNPLASGDYEVPDAGSDPVGLSADALWLHLIKRRMDKVYFRVAGSRHVLSLVKYRRQSGREEELWFMRLTPRLAPEVTLEVQAAGAAVRGVVAKPAVGVTRRLEADEVFILQRLDGETTLEEIARDHAAAHGPLDPKRVQDLYEFLEKNGMLAGGPQSAPTRWAFLRRLLNPNFSIPHADAVVTAVHHRLGFLVGPLGAWLLLAVGVSGLYPLLTHAIRLHSFHELEAFYIAHPVALGGLYLMMLLGVAAHQFGHGIVCKHFGGRVHRLGVMFYLASFIFYCDISSSYAFPRTSQRVWVALAGPLVVFAGLGAGLWLAGPLTQSGSDLEYLAVSFCGVCAVALVINCNPCIKMDGYYVLMDLLGIPDLRERSFAFLQRRLASWLGLADPEPGRPEPTPRERRVFWWYGIFGALFTVVFMLWPAILFSLVLARNSASQGGLVWGAFVLTMVGVRLANQAYARIASWRNREYRIL